VPEPLHQQHQSADDQEGAENHSGGDKMLILMKCLDEEFAIDRVMRNIHDEDFIDRVIVIDGGSTDYTVQELKKWSKVEVFVHPWLDHYFDQETAQSNIALSYVPHGALAFILDFDEMVSDELKKVLRTIKTQGFDYDTGHVSRKTFDVMRHEDSPFAILGEDGWPIISHQIGQYPDYQCRIIKKDYRMRWVNSPHHVLIGWEGMTNVNINADVIHYEKDDYRHRLRIERKWARCQATRKSLGLTRDIFECTPPAEIAKYTNQEEWK
jgi:hypothetical protein